jgi:hypothetical protein
MRRSWSPTSGLLWATRGSDWISLDSLTRIRVKVREMDAAGQIPNVQSLGEAEAREQVKMELFKGFF